MTSQNREHHVSSSSIVPSSLARRDFLAASGAAGLATLLPHTKQVAAATAGTTPETSVARLYAALTEKQRQVVCFDWGYTDPERGLLRTRVANNWQITKPEVQGDFYTAEQQVLIREVFEGIVQPDWHARFDKQLDDDAGGWGHSQSIAIFGKPGEDKFEFVLTGRHMTIRCDGNSSDHVAFGGPIFYGHDTGSFNEPADHQGNVFWHQAVAANQVFDMLDGKQRKTALMEKSPREQAVAFRGKDGPLPGIPISELSADQKEAMQGVLSKLIEPYRQADRDEVLSCLKAQGGLDACHLSFYQDKDIGDDGVWDNWRLEGPSFVWYFRGAPHVHVWVHVADDPSVQLNA